MNFRIADTFTDSLARLSGEEQKAVKTTAFDLQMNPANPGMQFHRLDHAKDRNFWSLRVSGDIRIIVHKTADSILLCYVDHHEEAYRWGERRKIETHPTTGAAQLVEVRETVQEIRVPRYVEEEAPAPPQRRPLAAIEDAELLAYGVPPEWLDELRDAGEDELLQLATRLPAEAADAVLELAVGGRPKPSTVPVAGADPFAHPDAQRRFRVMNNAEELDRALSYPWEKWTVFLHPAQRDLVEKSQGGPFRVSGSAGTGKTIVALHRAVHLAREHPEARVLLTTFSTLLANALRHRLRCLVGNEPRLAERLEVVPIQEVGLRLYKALVGPIRTAGPDQVRTILKKAAGSVDGHKFSNAFLMGEWEEVVDAWQLGSWEEYRDVARLGRKTRLPEKQRKVLWEIFEKVRGDLRDAGQVTEAGMFTLLARQIARREKPPFEFAVVDESQDVSVSQLRFLAALGGGRPDSLFFAGDPGQRIFQPAFAWKSLGVDIRGRSKTLRVNYRTSHQIRAQADRLLGIEISDMDGNTESRKGIISAFNGPAPVIHTAATEADECRAVSQWLKELIENDVQPGAVGVIVRSDAELPRAEKALKAAGIPFHRLKESMETNSTRATVCTMHQAKGLEFRAVVVMACDDEVIPLQDRIDSITDDSDLEEVYNTERHLLYVACTRAREYLLVTSGNTPTEFLGDLEAH